MEAFPKIFDKKRFNRLMALQNLDNPIKELQGLFVKNTTDPLWKSRINPKLHTQHVPKRYWKYLSEKKVS